MASSYRRSPQPFSLAFLDIMFCGFGAVVLLVLIINSNIVENRNETVEEQKYEFLQYQKITKTLDKKKNQLEQELNSLLRQINTLETTYSSLSDETRKKADIFSELQSQKSLPVTAALEKELKALQATKMQLEAEAINNRTIGSKVRQFEGEGNRQYLTGLKLGGKRVLILIDSSASMLDRKIVDIVRLKVRDEKQRRSAKKWQKAVTTVEWILANLPAESSVQLYSFNSSVTALSTTRVPAWQSITDFKNINAIVEMVKKLAPENGTNLERTFMKAGEISPQPDNIILITDGLPTQGQNTTLKGAVTGEKRVRLFEQAVKKLPSGIPVNTILFPIEGDPMSPVLYWKLAIESSGSFMTPTGDWP